MGRQNSPAALVVEEQDEVQLLFGLVLHLLSDAQHVHGGGGDGNPVVLTADTRHVGVDNLLAPGEAGRNGLDAHDTTRRQLGGLQ